MLFFASDNDDAEPMKGFALIVMMDDRDLTERLFEKLSEGGQITTPRHSAVERFYGSSPTGSAVQWTIIAH